MVNYYVFTLASLAAALPLNINLGAYSPALVVGDGEISFGGKQDVSSLMNALEGAAVNAAAGAAVAAPAAVQLAPATAAPAPVVAVAPPVSGAAADPILQEQAVQIAALQGMGKEIAPRVVAVNAPKLGARDLAGFDRALRFAEAALVKGPKIQLGTGGEGSGVGIIVDNNPTAAARPGTGNAGEGGVGVAAPAEGVVTQERRRRDVAAEDAPRRRAKVTTMYVRSGVPASLQSSEVARDVQAVSAAPVEAPVSKRDNFDSVNLNVDGAQGITMTFVEEDED